METYFAHYIMLGKRMTHPMLTKDFPFLTPPAPAKELKVSPPPASAPLEPLACGQPSNLEESTEVEMKSQTLESFEAEASGDSEMDVWDGSAVTLQEMLEELITSERINLLSYYTLSNSVKSLFHQYLEEKFDISIIEEIKRSFESSLGYLETSKFRKPSSRQPNKKLTMEIRGRLLFLQQIEKGAPKTSDILIRDFTHLYLQKFDNKQAKRGLIGFIEQAYAAATQEKPLKMKSCVVPFEVWLSDFATFLEGIIRINFEDVFSTYFERAKTKIERLLVLQSQRAEGSSFQEAVECDSSQNYLPLCKSEVESVDIFLLAEVVVDLSMVQRHCNDLKAGNVLPLSSTRWHERAEAPQFKTAPKGLSQTAPQKRPSKLDSMAEISMGSVL